MTDPGVNRLHPEVEPPSDPNAARVIAVTKAAGLERQRSGRWSLGRLWWWLVFILGALYFILPLVGTFVFSLKAQPFGSAYTNAIGDRQFVSTLTYSFVIGIITVIVSTVLIVPTAFWVRLKLPRWRPVVEFITLLPFVVPPIVLVFGLVNTYSRPPVPLTNSDLGSNVLIVSAYVILSFPYMYRAVDTGLRAIDVQTLTEASQSLGAGWLRLLVAGHLPEPAGRAAERRVPDPRDRDRRVHDRHIPGAARIRPIPLAPRRQQGLRTRGGVADQLRADLVRDDHDLGPRSRRPRPGADRGRSLRQKGLG